MHISIHVLCVMFMRHWLSCHILQANSHAGMYGLLLLLSSWFCILWQSLFVVGSFSLSVRRQSTIYPAPTYDVMDGSIMLCVSSSGPINFNVSIDTTIFKVFFSPGCNSTFSKARSRLYSGVVRRNSSNVKNRTVSAPARDPVFVTSIWMCKSSTIPPVAENSLYSNEV